MEQIFSVVPLNPPRERRGKLYYWGCQNRLTGRIWRQSLRVTPEAALKICERLNLDVQLSITGDKPGCLFWRPTRKAPSTIR